MFINVQTNNFEEERSYLLFIFIAINVYQKQCQRSSNKHEVGKRQGQGQKKRYKECKREIKRKGENVREIWCLCFRLYIEKFRDRFYVYTITGRGRERE